MNTVLFDLDGTLLQMDQEAFVNRYVGLLCEKAAPLGYAAEPMTAALWKGTYAMALNDGAISNRERCWDVFAQELGEGIRDAEADFIDFYSHEFNQTRDITTENPLAKEVIQLLREKGYTVALATNPLFPAEAVESRLGWLGLSMADFAYTTTYENSRYCKPNPAYFRQILAQLHKQPQDCLMVGNNLREDMAAQDLGLQVYLVTDFLENKDQADVDSFPHGSFQDFVAYARRLPDLKAATN